MDQKTVQIRSKKVNIDILDLDDNKIGTIRFNPDDTKIYFKFVTIIQQLTSGKKEADGVKFDQDEIERFESGLKELEDFDGFEATLDKLNRSGEINIELWDNACAGLDSIFGAGVCDCFTQGDADPELLTPLIDKVAPYFQESRQGKVSKYKANTSDVME